MPGYEIKVNVSGSWANLCNCPPEKIAAAKAVCLTLANLLEHPIAFKVLDADGVLRATLTRNRVADHQMGWRDHPSRQS